MARETYQFIPSKDTDDPWKNAGFPLDQRHI